MAETMITTRLNTCSVNGLQLAIAAAAAVDKPIMILGTMGVGKSTIAKAWATTNGYAFVDFRISQLLPEDAGGIPVADLAKETVRRLMPDIVSRVWDAHKATGKPVYVFLDEATSGTPSIQAALYEYVLDRRAAGFELPPGTRIGAAGNTVADRGVVYEVPRPMANRFIIVRYTGPTWDEYESYMIESGMHPTVMAFLKVSPEWLCNKINVDDDEGRNPTPRSWEAVSDLVKHCEKQNTPHAARMMLIAAAVGDTAALAFETTLQLADKLHTYEQVLMDPLGLDPHTDDIGLAYLQITSIVSRIADQKEFKKVWQYVDRMPKELLGVFFRTLLRDRVRWKLIANNLEMVALVQKYTTAGTNMR